jgi:hypothetical protein
MVEKRIGLPYSFGGVVIYWRPLISVHGLSSMGEKL